MHPTGNPRELIHNHIPGMQQYQVHRQSQSESESKIDAEMILPEAEHELIESSIASNSSGDDENSVIIYLVSIFFASEESQVKFSIGTYASFRNDHHNGTTAEEVYCRNKLFPNHGKQTRAFSREIVPLISTHQFLIIGRTMCCKENILCCLSQKKAKGVRHILLVMLLTPKWLQLFL